jgi:hypothetical protein
VPQISYFYGILIRMYWNEAQHAVPHFHVQYAIHKASVGFDGTVLGGSLPRAAFASSVSGPTSTRMSSTPTGSELAVWNH